MKLLLLLPFLVACQVKIPPKIDTSGHQTVDVKYTIETHIVLTCQKLHEETGVEFTECFEQEKEKLLNSVYTPIKESYSEEPIIYIPIKDSFNEDDPNTVMEETSRQ